MYKILIFSILLLFVGSCQPDQSLTDGGLSLSWDVKGVNVDAYRSTIHFVLVNNTNEALIGGDWSLHWNQMSGGPDNESLPKGLSAKRINGDYYILSSSPGNDIPPGDSLVIDYTLRGLAKRMSMVPVGPFVHLAKANKTIEVDSKVSLNQAKGIVDLQAPTAASRYADNLSLSRMDKNEIDWIVPSPKSVKINEGSSWKIPVTLSCIIPSEFAALENPLTLLFRQQKLIPVDFVSDNESIEVKKVNGLGPEAYHLYLNPEKITIEAGDQAGAFYAFQSLAQLLFHAHEEGLAEIPAMIVEDAPRFSYRGMHFDIGRNYFGPAKIKQLMDFMALFKMNKFHFNITEDEGWRIEIPSLPELTEVGAKRGYTPDESDRLNPAYGSGGNGDNPRGSGYFTRAEYIDLIKYADERHIEIIPEINAPGHARAAIVSMRARYNKYLAQGDEAKAKEFMLHDPDDKSEYRSAQQYDDNVICVCQESSFNFIFKVIDEIAKMYDEAGVKMKMYHTGGDELPYGAWQKSPICADFLASHPEVDGTNDLHAYFMRRVIDYVRPKGLAIGGWEEIVLEHGPDGHNGTDINTSFVSNDIVPYVWNATWGSGREDMVYRLANVGYDVVMANSSSFYFDMTTDKDLDNYGLDWSGYTSYKDAWSTEPLDIFKKPRGIDPAQNNTQERVRLQPTARKHFLGIQGQMWTETVRSEAILDELMMPNLPIFAERAWAEPSSWAAESSNEEIEWALDKDWNQFANTIGQRAIHLTGSLFGGTQYDLPKPGAIIENGKLKANTMFPGQEIRYTLDGSLPDANSPIYEGEPEVPAGSKVVLRTFDRNGRGGRPIRVDQ